MMDSMKFSRDIAMLLLAAVCGGLAGGVTSNVLRRPASDARIGITSSTNTAFGLGPTSTEPVLSFIPVPRRAGISIVPPPLLKRRSSAIAMLYRKSKGMTLEERMLGPERLLGRAIALTSDGWFITTLGAIDSLRLAEIVVWHNGSSYPVERGVLDRLNSTVYLKTDAHGLTAPAFAQAEEATAGSEVWIENRPDGFSPHLIVDAGARLAPNDPVSSEIASRRLIVNRVTRAGERGSAAWDPSGSLMGIVDSKEGEELRLIPAGTVAASLASLLGKGEIRHALFGVRALDLAAARFSGSRNGLPLQGARVVADKRSIAKLFSGDVILRVDRDILDGRADLGEILAEYKPGASVTLRVLRDGKDIDVPVTFGTIVTSEVLK